MNLSIRLRVSIERQTSSEILIELFAAFTITLVENLLRDIRENRIFGINKNSPLETREIKVINFHLAMFVECEISKASVACSGLSQRLYSCKS